MKIVAFLQNQWFKDPERVKRIVADTIKRESDRTPEEIREWYTAAFLFMGCLTGRRLKTAFGQELCEEIVWEEVSREIGGKSSSAFPADHEHIREVIARHKPDVILAFGKIAGNALQRTKTIVIEGPHPAARHATVPNDLRIMREQLDRIRATRTTAEVRA